MDFIKSISITRIALIHLLCYLCYQLHRGFIELRLVISDLSWYRLFMNIETELYDVLKLYFCKTY
jgi:hypothetical protein